MSPKIYTQKFKDIVVKYDECNHTIKETKDHFKVTSVSFFVGFPVHRSPHSLKETGILSP